MPIGIDHPVVHLIASTQSPPVMAVPCRHWDSRERVKPAFVSSSVVPLLTAVR